METFSLLLMLAFIGYQIDAGLYRINSTLGDINETLKRNAQDPR